MADFRDYIEWRGDLSFAVSPFNEVDNLILAMFSFIDFSVAVSPELVDGPVSITESLRAYRKKYPKGERFGQIIPQSVGELFENAAATVRFSDLYVAAARSVLDEDVGVQFAAVTFILPDHSLYVSYRGTDDTLVGWREDFSLSFESPVPAQRMASEYLEEIAGFFSGKIRTGGHSKGGNLSVYAATHVSKPVRDRIITAYSNDGPGFPAEMLFTEEYKELENRICTFVPQSSLVGMLLEHDDNYQVIESTMKAGIYQHDPFSWQVKGTSFVHRDKLSPEGKQNEEVVRSWLSHMSGEDRRHITDTLFEILESTGAKTLSDLAVDRFGKMITAVRTFSGLDRETRDNLFRFSKLLAETVIGYKPNESGRNDS